MKIRAFCACILHVAFCMIAQFARCILHAASLHFASCILQRRAFCIVHFARRPRCILHVAFCTMSALARSTGQPVRLSVRPMAPQPMSAAWVPCTAHDNFRLCGMGASAKIALYARTSMVTCVRRGIKCTYRHAYTPEKRVALTMARLGLTSTHAQRAHAHSTVWSGYQVGTSPPGQ